MNMNLKNFAAAPCIPRIRTRYSDARGPWIQNILSIALAEFARQNSAAAEQ